MRQVALRSALRIEASQALGGAQVLGGARVKPIGPFAMTRAPGGARVCPSARWLLVVPQH